MFTKTQIAIPNEDSLQHDTVYIIDALVQNGLAVHRTIYDVDGRITLGDWTVTHLESGMRQASNFTYESAKAYVRLFNKGMTDKTTVDIAYSNRLKRYIYKPSKEYGGLHNEIMRNFYRP